MKLSDATRPIDTDAYEPIEHYRGYKDFPTPPTVTGTPIFNSFLRCQLPLVNASSDNLRQFYHYGVPQFRIMASF